MKKSILAITAVLLVSAYAFADISLPYWGDASGGITMSTVFTGDLSDGSTGLYTDMGADLWFTLTPFGQNMGGSESRNGVKFSLKASGWLYQWRGYTFLRDENFSDEKDNDEYGIDRSLGAGDFIAKIEWGKFWLSLAGVEPQITMNQMSIRTVFDDVIEQDTDDDNQYYQLPLFHVGAGYSEPRISSVIGLDLVHLDYSEIQIYGMYALGFDGDYVKAQIKAGSWKNGYQNVDNSWVLGGDLEVKPIPASTISLTLLYATNYDVYTDEGLSREQLTSDDEVITSVTTSIANVYKHPDEDEDALKEAPLAIGLGYQHDFNIGMGVLRPYVGADFIFQTERDDATKAKRKKINMYEDDFAFEVGGGIEWLFLGPSKRTPRSEEIGGMQLANGPSSKVGLDLGVNVDNHGIVNAVLSFNMDPAANSWGLGGFLQMEFMNLTGQTYWAPSGASNSYYDRTNYKDPMWAMVGQVEYKVNNIFMPYLFAWYVPSANTRDSATGTASYPATRSAYVNHNVAPTYHPEDVTLTTKVGCRITPFQHFYFDVWYERTDIYAHKKYGSIPKGWTTDDGMISIKFGIDL